MEKCSKRERVPEKRLAREGKCKSSKESPVLGKKKFQNPVGGKILHPPGRDLGLKEGVAEGGRNL